MRAVIDEYTYDKQHSPQTLDDVVRRRLPAPGAHRPDYQLFDTWKTMREDASNTVNQSQPGSFDVRSDAEKTSLKGSPYSGW